MTDNNKNESILNQEKDKKIKIQEYIGSSKK